MPSLGLDFTRNSLTATPDCPAVVNSFNYLRIRFAATATQCGALRVK